MRLRVFFILIVVLILLDANARTCSEIFQDKTAISESQRVVFISAFHKETTMKVQAQILSALEKNRVKVNLIDNSVNAWIRDWFPVHFRNSKGENVFLNFDYENIPVVDYIKGELADRIRRAGYKVIDFPFIFEGGNIFITEKGHFFASASKEFIEINRANSMSLLEIQKQIEEKTNLKVIWMPELNREETGHLDVYSIYIGRNTFVVSDSREPKRKKILDAAAQKLIDNGYTVHRIMNAGRDNFRGKINFSYANALVIQELALVPVYSNYYKTVMAKYRMLFQDFLGDSVDVFSTSRNEYQQVIADDNNALKLYSDLGFKVIPIEMDSTLELFGMVHCLTSCAPASLAEKLDNLEDISSE